MGVFDEYRGDTFAVYSVELTFEDKIMGGVPKNPKIVQGWLRSKAGITEARELFQVTARTMEENGTPLGVSPTALVEMDADEMYNVIDQASEEQAALKSTNGFKVDEDGLYIEARQIQAMLKESTNVLFAGERWGKTKKGPKSFVAERVFARPTRIHLGREEPDGVESLVKHIQDQMGKRSTLGLCEYVKDATIEFNLEVLRDELTQEQWGQLFLHAQSNGLGAERSQGFGRFEVTKWERVG